MPSGLNKDEVQELYVRYGYLVLRRCHLLLRDQGLAEDAVQETFMRVMRYGAQIRVARSPLRWLYRTSDRCCFDLVGRRRRLVVLDLEDRPGSTPSGQLEARDAVLALLSRLNARDRRIAVLTFVDGLTQAQVGQELGISRVTVNKQLGKIRHVARALLDARAPQPLEAKDDRTPNDV